MHSTGCEPCVFFSLFFFSSLFHELKYCGDYVFRVHHLIHCLTFTRNLASSKITEHISNKSGIAILNFFIMYLFFIGSSFFVCVNKKLFAFDCSFGNDSL